MRLGRKHVTGLALIIIVLGLISIVSATISHHWTVVEFTDYDDMAYKVYFGLFSYDSCTTVDQTNSNCIRNAISTLESNSNEHARNYLKAAKVTLGLNSLTILLTALIFCFCLLLTLDIYFVHISSRKLLIVTTCICILLLTIVATSIIVYTALSGTMEWVATIPTYVCKFGYAFWLANVTLICFSCALILFIVCFNVSPDVI